ncbi:MAG: carbohydrate ABC transporter permease [Acidimicrobiia bacterium]|nr:carbohydrate ABC transporter permease [Acidimicrobiia bacterium]
MTRDVFEQKLFGSLKWISIVFFVLITVFPLLYMVALSFKDVSQLLREPSAFLPSWEELKTLKSYKSVLTSVDSGGFGFVRFIVNSLLVSGLTVVITVTLAVLGAYSAARLQFRGKKAVSSGILIIYLFPAVVVAIPLFVMFSRLGIRSELWALSIVYLAQTIPLALYMLKSHFQAIPASLEEAGMIDGLTRFGVIRRITIPLSAPAIAAVALYVFMIAWNEFLFALLFLVDSPVKWTLPLGLQQLNSTEVPMTALMAGSVIITIPVIALFFAAEKFLTEGLASGGVKG